MAQLGIDSHRTDPLTHLALTVQGFAAAGRASSSSCAPAWWPLAAAATTFPTWPGLDRAWAAMNDVALPPDVPGRGPMESWPGTGSPR